MSRKQICPACNGEKTEMRGSWGFDVGVFDCGLCNGQGVIPKRVANALKKAENRTDEQWEKLYEMYEKQAGDIVACPAGDCNGCDFCGGNGWVKADRVANYPQWLVEFEAEQAAYNAQFLADKKVLP